MTSSVLYGVGLDELSAMSSGMEAFAGARLISLGDGAERGVRVVEMRSAGGLEVEIVVDRGGDLGRLAYNGQPLSWHTPHGLRAPWLFDSESDNGQGFLRGVGGFLNTCGFDHIRQPDSEGSGGLNESMSGRTDYPLHGKGAFQPAVLRGYGLVEQADEPFIFCETECVQSMAFVSALRLRRRIEMKVGSRSISINDTVTNIGSNPTTHMILYHFNLGFPMVAPGTEIEFPNSDQVWQSDDHDPLSAFPEPECNSANRLSLFKPETDCATASVTSPHAGLRLHIDFPTRQLPYCQLLRMTRTRQYGIGIEPCTTGARSRQEARDRGEMIILNPGQSRQYSLKVGLEITSSQGGL